MDEDYKLELLEEDRELSRLQDILNVVASTVFAMYNNKYPLEDYYIYEAYNKESNTTAMSKLVNRMALMGKPILLGERIAYLIVDRPSFKKGMAIGPRMRLPDDIVYPETIYQTHYVEKMATAIDSILYAVYGKDTLMEKLLTQKVLSSKLVKKLGLTLPNGNLVDYHYNLIRQRVKEDFRHFLKPTYAEMIAYSNSVEYAAEVPSNAKTNITSNINKVNKEGYGLLIPNTAIVSNIILAHNIGCMYEYKESLCTLYNPV